MISRKAVESDYIELIDIWEQSVRQTHTFLEESDLLEIKKNLPVYFAHVDLLVWMVEEKLIGFSGTNEGNLEMLFLSPSVFRKGYGRAILEELIQQKKVTSVDVNEQNKGAAAFYKTLGFQLISRDDLDDQGKPYPILHLKLVK